MELVRLGEERGFGMRGEENGGESPNRPEPSDRRAKALVKKTESAPSAPTGNGWPPPGKHNSNYCLVDYGGQGRRDDRRHGPVWVVVLVEKDDGRDGARNKGERTEKRPRKGSRRCV